MGVDGMYLIFFHFTCSVQVKIYEFQFLGANTILINNRDMHWTQIRTVIKERFSKHDPDVEQPHSRNPRQGNFIQF